MSIKWLMSIAGLLLFISPCGAWSAEKERERMQESEMQHERLQDRDRREDKEEELGRFRDEERIYGWQLMSPAERQLHREKMRSLKTRQEREAYRKQHHELMKKRAEEKGVELQNMPE